MELVPPHDSSRPGNNRIINSAWIGQPGYILDSFLVLLPLFLSLRFECFLFYQSGGWRPNGVKSTPLVDGNYNAASSHLHHFIP